MTASQVTALSAAIGGTTRLLERLGATEATHAIERCLKRMERSVAGQGGHLVGTTEGELLATFDSAEQACLAAIDMQLRVATLPPVSGFKLPIRIGLHGAARKSKAERAGNAAILTEQMVGCLKICFIFLFWDA